MEIDEAIKKAIISVFNYVILSSYGNLYIEYDNKKIINLIDQSLDKKNVVRMNMDEKDYLKLINKYNLYDLLINSEIVNNVYDHCYRNSVYTSDEITRINILLILNQCKFLKEIWYDHSFFEYLKSLSASEKKTPPPDKLFTLIKELHDKTINVNTDKSSSNIYS